MSSWQRFYDQSSSQPARQHRYFPTVANQAQGYQWKERYQSIGNQMDWSDYTTENPFQVGGQQQHRGTGYSNQQMAGTGVQARYDQRYKPYDVEHSDFGGPQRKLPKEKHCPCCPKSGQNAPDTLTKKRKPVVQATEWGPSYDRPAANYGQAFKSGAVRGQIDLKFVASPTIGKRYYQQQRLNWQGRSDATPDKSWEQGHHRMSKNQLKLQKQRKTQAYWQELQGNLQNHGTRQRVDLTSDKAVDLTLDDIIEANGPR